MDKGKVEDFKIFSKELNEEVEVLVYLPPQYTPFQKYSYIIAQDGKDYFQLGRISRTLDELINQGEMEPILFFGVPYRSVQDRRDKYHPNGKKFHSYTRFLSNELVSYIDNEYPVLNLGKSRALAGDSLAATVSLLTAMEYPHTFGNVLMHSPLVDEIILEYVQNFSKWDLLNLYHVIGKEETEVQLTDGTIADFLSPNRKLNQLITKQTNQYFYDEFNGNHTWKYWQSDLKRALTHIFPA